MTPLDCRKNKRKIYRITIVPFGSQESLIAGEVTRPTWAGIIKRLLRVGSGLQETRNFVLDFAGNCGKKHSIKPHVSHLQCFFYAFFVRVIQTLVPTKFMWLLFLYFAFVSLSCFCVFFLFLQFLILYSKGGLKLMDATIKIFIVKCEKSYSYY